MPPPSMHSALPTPPPSTQPAPPPASSSLPPGECAAFIGLDWGDHQHVLALWSPSSGTTEVCTLVHSAEALHAWLDQLRLRFNGQPVALAIEASRGAVVAALLEHPWLRIYPVHSTSSRHVSRAFASSGAKRDESDALTLLEILQKHRHKLRLLLPQEPATERLTLLARARRSLVDRRTQLSNQLTSLLKHYYPQALALIGDRRYAPLALAFLERWPELAALQRAKPETIRQFFWAHGVRRPEAIAARLELIRSARPLSLDRVLCEVSMLELRALLAQLRALEKPLAAFEAAIASAFNAFPDAFLFASLPGAGSAMAPRLAALFGSDRSRWTSPQQMQMAFGVAPVEEQSGKQRWVHWRWNAPIFARQTLVEWAGLSVRFSAWAKAYYHQQKLRRHGHSAILRSLAFKWLRILWRCWQSRTPYDEARYLERLRLRHPSFHASISSFPLA